MRCTPSRVGPLVAVLALVVSAAAFRPATPAVDFAARDPVVAKALTAWLKTYRKGKLAIGSNADAAKDSIARKHGLAPKGMLGRLTHLRDLEILLDAAVEKPAADTTTLLLEVATVGLDSVKLRGARGPHLVRRAANARLDTLAATPDGAEVLRTVARDGIRKSKDTGAAMQAQALRTLARASRSEPDREHATFVAALDATSVLVRAGAAEALELAPTAGTCAPLAKRLTDESDEGVLTRLARALNATLDAHRSKVPAADLDAAVDAAIGALGRSTWRVDERLVDFLDRARLKRAVPALIDVLQRFVDDPRAVAGGTLTGVLRHRTHEALISLTGTYHAMRDVDAWRSWWAGVEAEFAVPKLKSADGGAEGDGKTTSGFFGIPVQGTRVVFVVDLSLSMRATMPVDTSGGAEVPTKLPTRLDVAKEEILRAVAALADDAKFNLVMFSKTSRAWQKDLVAATKSNKSKFEKFVGKLKPEPYTNLWSGIERALKVRAADGTREEIGLDEVFILSDGAPTIGDVTDEEEILRLVTETNRFAKIRINTVFIASGDNAMDPNPIEEDGLGPEELMKKIAAQNDGRFVHR